MLEPLMSSTTPWSYVNKFKTKVSSNSFNV